jgi:hypothetical protein
MNAYTVAGRHSNLLLFADSGLEAAFKAYVGLRSFWLALLLRILLLLAWVSAAWKFSNSRDTAECDERCAVLTFVYSLAVGASVLGVAAFLYERRRLAYGNLERYKLVLFGANVVFATAGVILLRQGEMAISTPVHVALNQGGMILFDQFRLDVALKLYPVVLMCFFFMEAGKV